MIYPKVKYVPEWFPGAGFKRFAKEGGRVFGMAVEGPLEWVKGSLKVIQCGLCERLDSWTDAWISPMEATLPSLHRISIAQSNFRIKDSTKVTSGR